MARTVEQIKASLYEKIEAKDDLAALFANPSQAKLWGEIIHTIAVDIAVFEQMIDQHESETTDYFNRVYDTNWLRERVFEFQYDAATPQEVAMDGDLEVAYPVIDEDLRIITVCSVYRTANQDIRIRVAKDDPPVALTAPELAALQAYMDDGGDANNLPIGIGVAGGTHLCETDDPDYIWLEAVIRYDGDYTDSIQNAVKIAIVDYYHNLDADGVLRVAALEKAVMAVPGVTDFQIENLAVRPNATAFASRTYLVQAFDTLLSTNEVAAGYAYEEVTAGETLTDKLTFTVG